MITFEQAVLLPKAGFNSYAKMCVIRYDEDFIYDEDPEHPESHRAGDIRIYDIYWEPLTGELYNKNLYPMMLQSSFLDWLREKKNLHVLLEPFKTSVAWNFRLFDLKTKDMLVSQVFLGSKYEDVLDDVITFILSYLINKKDNEASSE